MPTKTDQAVAESRTIYLKTLKVPGVHIPKTGLQVLKAAKSNTKLSGRSSKVISKGPRLFRGSPLYNLTLQERATCPSTCEQWSNCYGNNMPFAARYEHGSGLEVSLHTDLQTLQQKHPEGFVVRLHILGDFYSLGYVQFWERMLDQYPALRIYGYTHRKHGSEIGDAVARLVARQPNRVGILRSDRSYASDPLTGAYTVPVGIEPQEGIVVCPQQTGKTESCLTCGLCFHGTIPVQFLEH